MEKLLNTIGRISANLGIISKNKIKEISELRYWKYRKKNEKTLSNSHYKYFYTSHFGLDEEFYFNKKILDIGCGPRGSLEWADMTEERVGLDPLANEYLKLGADQQKMKYVSAYSENIPFADGYFDVVCSFNSIDHVEDLKKTCEEIKRVIKKGGLLLILTDIHEKPTINEPQVFSWDFAKKYFSDLENLEEKHFEKGKGVYDGIRKGIIFNHEDPRKRYGTLSVKLMKK